MSGHHFGFWESGLDGINYAKENFPKRLQIKRAVSEDVFNNCSLKQPFFIRSLFGSILKSNFIELRKGKEKLIYKNFNWNIYSLCLCKRVYLVFVVSCDQSSELLTTDLYSRKLLAKKGCFRRCFFKLLSITALFCRQYLSINFRDLKPVQIVSILISKTNYTRNKQIMCWNYVFVLDLNIFRT